VLSVLKDRANTLVQGFFLAFAKDLDIAKDQGSSLVIAPHPDDESLGCGATIARLRSCGNRVHIIIVTDGAASGRSAIIGPKKLAAIRRLETLEAANELGVPPQDVLFLEFPDSHTQEAASAIEAALAEQICALMPQRIFSPHGIDGHRDHRVIAAAIDRLFRRGTIACQVYEYPIWFWSYRALAHLFQPQTLILLRRVATQGFLAAKKAAIAAHCSQNVALTEEAGWFTLQDRFVARLLVSFELFFEKPLHKSQKHGNSPDRVRRLVRQESFESKGAPWFGEGGIR
jgi:LmbE family N-acetylglucosaminyl deacetylase